MWETIMCICIPIMYRDLFNYIIRHYKANEWQESWITNWHLKWWTTICSVYIYIYIVCLPSCLYYKDYTMMTKLIWEIPILANIKEGMNVIQDKTNEHSKLFWKMTIYFLVKSMAMKLNVVLILVFAVCSVISNCPSEPKGKLYHV